LAAGTGWVVARCSRAAGPRGSKCPSRRLGRRRANDTPIEGSANHWVAYRSVPAERSIGSVLEDVRDTLVGSWHGVANTPWTKPYAVDLTFTRHGHDSSRCSDSIAAHYDLRRVKRRPPRWGARRRATVTPERADRSTLARSTALRAEARAGLPIGSGLPYAPHS
jgi:hypothetical protein